jgi:threonine dehydrogenase-like Zn-dependent dehydrogenase
VYTLPFYAESSMTYYSTDLFRKAGLTMPLHPTWDQIASFAKKLHGRQSPIASVRKGGEVVVVGVFGQDVLVPAAPVQDRELHLRGSLMYTRGDFQEAARLLADGKVQEDLLVTHRVGLEDVHHAFELARRRAEALKVLVVPEG